MFPAEKKGEFEPYKVREKRREVKVTNGTQKEDVEMKEAPQEGAENAEKTQPAEQQNEGADGADADEAAEAKQQEPTEDIVYEEDIVSDEGAVYPIRNGHIVDWPCFLSLLTHIYNTLSPPFHTPIMLISEPAWSARDRETLTQFIFEKFKTPAFCLMDAALAACYAYGTSTATVIDVGHGKADVTVVTDFIVQEHGRGIAVEGCGGEAMTDRLEELLKPKGFTREMCEQLKRSNITEILPQGTPLPGSASTADQGINPAAAASTGASDGQPKTSVPRGPGSGTQTGIEGNGEGEEDEGILNVAAIVTGNTSEFLAKREREKAEKAAIKKASADQANKLLRLPNAKKEKASFQFEEFVRIDDTSGQYIRQKREIEIGIERFLAATPTKERTDRCSDGILEDLAAQIHHTILSVPDATKRSELWDSLIILGNGSRVKGEISFPFLPFASFLMRLQVSLKP
jgi:actin-related protein 9